MTYRPEDFKPGVEPATPASSPKTAKGGKGKLGAEYLKLGRPPIPSVLPAPKLPKKLDDLLLEGCNPDGSHYGDGSRSGSVLYAIAELHRLGIPHGDILALVTHEFHGISEHLREHSGRSPIEQASRLLNLAIADEKAELAETFKEKENDASVESDKEIKHSFEQICKDWVWVSTLKRFVKRDDPNVAHDKEAFNDRFRYARGKHSSLTNRMFAKPGLIRKVDHMVYKPNEPEYIDNAWNQWKPSPVKPVKGDTTLFHKHLDFMFPRQADQTHLLNWMAAVLQNLGTKPRHHLIVIGNVQRTGKSFFNRLMAKLVGEENWQPLTQDILSNSFTGWAKHTKLVTVEEVRNLDKKEITSKLHVWASESTITINEKMLPTFRMEQVIAFMLDSNKDDPLGLDDTDGRYLVLKTLVTAPHPDGMKHYDAVYGVNKVGGILQTLELLGAILWELLHRDLGNYRIEGPAPFTVAKADVITAGATDIERWMLEGAGEYPLNRRVTTLKAISKSLPMANPSARTIMDVLTRRFKGIAWPTQIRPDGREGAKLRVWVLGDAAAKPDKLTTEKVLTMYREDLAGAVAPEAGDFDEG